MSKYEYSSTGSRVFNLGLRDRVGGKYYHLILSILVRK